MVHLMERECRIHKDKEPQGSSPYAAVVGATIPVALGKADRHQRAFMENVYHGTAGQSSRWIRDPADKGCTLPRCGVPTFP